MEIDGILPVTYADEGVLKSKIIYRSDDGYFSVDANDIENDAYDQFAAASFSADNYSPLADFTATVLEEADPEIQVLVTSEDESEIWIDGEFQTAEPASALLYALSTGGEVAVTEDLVEEKLEDIGEIKAPDENCWFHPSVEDINIGEPSLDSGEFGKKLEYDKHGYSECGDQRRRELHNAMEFSNGEAEAVKFLPEELGNLPTSQLRLEMKRKLEDGEFSSDKLFSAATMAAQPSRDIRYEDIEMDVPAITSKLIADNEMDIDVYWSQNRDNETVFAELEETTVEVDDVSLASLFPTALDEIWVKDSDEPNGSAFM